MMTEELDWGPDLRTPREWELEFDLVIMDPDGWRVDEKSFEDPITREDFEKRMFVSTIKPGPNSFGGK